MSARAGVRSVSQEQINAAYSMGASKWQVIWHVIVPAAMPEILTGDAHRDRLRLDDARRRRDGGGQRGPRPDGAERVELPAHRHRHHGHLVIGVVAYLFDLLMRYVERVVVPWKGKI